jgi:hypothetical protein
MPKVPGAQRATVAPSKIGYLLTFRPVDDKSRFFLGRGFNLAQPQLLIDALIRHVNEHDYMSSRTNKVGTTNYEVIGELDTPRGRSRKILTVWTIDPGSPPHFVTAHP